MAMEGNSVAPRSTGRGYVAAAFLVLAAILCGVSASRGEYAGAYFTSAAGFLLLAPHALLHPVSLRRSVSENLAAPTQSPRPIVVLSLVGVALIISSMAVRHFSGVSA